MVAALNCSNDDFIRTREERHKRASQEFWRRMQAAGDIYLDKYAGWYSVRDEAYYDESELKDGADGRSSRRKARRSNGSRRRAISSGSRPTRTSCSLITRRIPSSSGRRRARTRLRASCGAACRISVSRTTFDWGVPVPGYPKHIMYVWVDALTNYLTGVGFPDELGELPSLLAGRRAYHRQGHHPLPCGLLAGIPDVGGRRPAEAGVRPRLSLQSRGKNVEIGRQCRRSVHARADYGADQIRYFLLREVPFGQDGNYSREGSCSASTPISPTISATSPSAR